MQRISLLVSLFVSLLIGGNAVASTSVDQAEQLFERYTALEQAYDPAILELYADDAMVTRVQLLPDGTRKVNQLEGRWYKDLVRQMLPGAKVEPDTISYSQMSFTGLEDGRVEVRGMRHSSRQDRYQPIQMVVGPTASGEWRILEERVVVVREE